MGLVNYSNPTKIQGLDFTAEGEVKSSLYLNSAFCLYQLLTQITVFFSELGIFYFSLTLKFLHTYLYLNNYYYFILSINLIFFFE